MSTWALRIETRSPSGVGREWIHSHGWSDKEDAQREADFGNKYLDTEKCTNGTIDSYYWYIEEEIPSL
jgi:hypothetical protein